MIKLEDIKVHKAYRNKSNKQDALKLSVIGSKARLLGDVWPWNFIFHSLLILATPRQIYQLPGHKLGSRKFPA